MVGTKVREQIDTPELPAYHESWKQSGKTEEAYFVWCGYCLDWHMHGAQDGHKSAHCLTDRYPKGTPYKADGYILQYAGEMDAKERNAYRREQRNLLINLIKTPKGVVVIDPHKMTLLCTVCQQEWSPNLIQGGRMPRNGKNALMGVQRPYNA
jgi:hypothetical protein